LEQAARTLGASRWRAFRLVTLPLLAPAVGAAALLVFLFDFTSFGVILVLGGPRFATLEVEIYRQTIALFNLPLAAALALVQLGCTLLITSAYTRLTAHLSRPLPLRARTLTQQRLLGWRQRLAGATLTAVLLILLAAPLAALAARSITRLEPERRQANFQPGLTWEYYRELGLNRRGTLFYAPPLAAAGVSAAYATATLVISLALGLPAAWALAAETGSPFNRWMDALLMLPLGASALTLGLGFVIALDEPPLDLRASPLLVPLAHTLVAFPFVVRTLAPALRSIRPQLRQAAAVLGANPWQVFRQVELPIVARALAVAGVFAFTISLGEFGATAILARPEYPTLPVVIFRYLSQPGALNYGQAMALSTLLMVVTGLALLLIERARVTGTSEF
jgi:thiamine transport system permease protein